MVQYITKAGLEKIKMELAELKNKRIEISKKIEESKSLGDLSENAEYIAAREMQSFNEGRILELENLIKDAVIIENDHSDNVQIGSTVEVSLNGKNQVFVIVGSQESDPEHGKISNESPLGKAFLGHKKGDIIKIKTPNKIVEYKILSVN